MKVDAAICLHYGADYLGHAMRSIYDQVDRFFIVYSPFPSHGSRTTQLCPESEEQLKAVAMQAGSNKVHWDTVTGFKYEGQHRDYLYAKSDANLLLVVDADEVWRPDVLERALRHVTDNRCSKWRVNMTTLWRSFSWHCIDNMWPDRILDRRHPRDDIGYIPIELGPIHHFGYSISNSIMSYKAAIHGHKSEWRPRWFEEKWSAWPPVDDCHPTCENTWFPKTYDREQLAPVMRLHHWWNAEKIE